MKEMPGVIFLVDPKKERIAILEAKKLGISSNRISRHKLQSRRC